MIDRFKKNKNVEIKKDNTSRGLNITTSNNNLPTGSLFKTFIDSTVLGAGVSVGSRVIDNIFGPRRIQSVSECDDYFKRYQHCITNGTQLDCSSIIPDKCKNAGYNISL